MFYRKLLLLVGIIIIFFSCREEKPLSFLETNISTKNNKLVEINIPRVVGNNKLSSQINNEIDAQVMSVLHLGQDKTVTAKTIEESIDLFNAEYDIFKADFPDFSHPWEAQVDGEVMLQTPEIISLAMTSYINTGGAHGITNIRFLNFDSVTGKRLDNQDVITDRVGFESVVKTYFMDVITKDHNLFEPDVFILPENIGFNDAGIILLYNQYEIAPYSTGIIEFTIPMEKVSAYLTFNGAQ